MKLTIRVHKCTFDSFFKGKGAAAATSSHAPSFFPPFLLSNAGVLACLDSFMNIAMEQVRVRVC